jgi:hypothetical protein
MPEQKQNRLAIFNPPITMACVLPKAMHSTLLLKDYSVSMDSRYNLVLPLSICGDKG